MAEAASPASGQRYGVARVCRVWAVPRSSFYAARKPGTGSTTKPVRRGPQPSVSDDALLAAIKNDLERSPWTGEGHRKVWARLRAIDGIRVARKRVLRLMRERALCWRGALACGLRGRAAPAPDAHRPIDRISACDSVHAGLHHAGLRSDKWLSKETGCSSAPCPPALVHDPG